jgi:hypothetical protein
LAKIRSVDTKKFSLYDWATKRSKAKGTDLHEEAKGTQGKVDHAKNAKTWGTKRRDRDKKLVGRFIILLLCILALFDLFPRPRHFFIVF